MQSKQRANLILSDDTNFAMKIDGLCEVEFFVKRSVQMRTRALTKNERAQGAILTQNSIKNKGQFYKTDPCFLLCSAPDSVRPLQVLPQQTAPERHPRGTHKYIFIAASART